MVREGYWFGLPPLLLGMVLLIVRGEWQTAAGAILLLLGLFVFSFFRNPERVIPVGTGADCVARGRTCGRGQR